MFDTVFLFSGDCQQELHTGGCRPPIDTHAHVSASSQQQQLDNNKPSPLRFRAITSRAHARALEHVKHGVGTRRLLAHAPPVERLRSLV